MTADRSRSPGYRGTLAPREDRLARPWTAGVIGIFLLVFALSGLGVPSRLFPEPTPVPLPTGPLPSIPVPSFSIPAEPSPLPSPVPSPSR
jgi:hypothetical protein